MSRLPVASGFVDFLRAIDVRFLQERDVGLDIYLSGAWGVIPAALAVVSATVFLLAIFHAVPSRRVSIPVLLATGLIAAAVGLLGTYLNYRQVEPGSGAPPLRVLTAGSGNLPISEGQRAALLALPLILGGGVIAESLAWTAFLLLFGARDPERRARRGKNAS